MKVALYARYSSDNQRDASIVDQFRICRVYAEKQGWQIVEEYSDQAISGARCARGSGEAPVRTAGNVPAGAWVKALRWLGMSSTREC